MRSCIFSIITAVFSVTWSSEITLMYYQCWKQLCWIIVFWNPWCLFQDTLMNKKLNEQHFLNIYIFCNNIQKKKIMIFIKQWCVQLKKSNRKDFYCYKRWIFVINAVHELLWTDRTWLLDSMHSFLNITQTTTTNQRWPSLSRSLKVSAAFGRSRKSWASSKVRLKKTVR